MPELEPASDLPFEAYEASRDPASWVDHYIRLERVGAGGMSVVYRAFDTRLRIEVALKFLNPEQDAELLAHGEREGRITARIEDPAVPRVYTQGTWRGQHYVAMQFIRGVGLDKYRPKDDREAAALMRDIARAVHKAHVEGIVHRDISPENIMIAETGEGVRPYLLDFGVAQLGTERLTAKGVVIGKRHYCSPDQLENRIDARSDVYALGATLYFAATGARPFDEVGETAMMEAILHRDPARPRSLRRALSRDLETVILVAMDKDPAHRYASAAEFAKALERFLAGEDVGRRPSAWRALARKARRHRRILAVAAACLAVAAASVGYAAHRLAKVAESEREAWELRYDLAADPSGSMWLEETPPPARPARADGGRLLLHNPDGQATLRFAQEVPGDVRIEYVAEVRADSSRVCDASVFVNAASAIAGGYFVGIGSEFNARGKIVRAHHLVAVNPAVRLEKGRRYRVVVQRDERGVRAWLDGELVLVYDDVLPVPHERAGIGFYANHSRVDLHEVRVWSRRVPARVAKVRVADRLLGAGDYTGAAQACAELLRDPEMAPARGELEFKRAVALWRRGDPADRAGALATLDRLASDPSLGVQAVSAAAALRLAGGDVNGAVARVASALPGAPANVRFRLLAVFDHAYGERVSRRDWDEALRIASAVMTRFRAEAVSTLGTSNFNNNLALAWVEVEWARGRDDAALALLQDLYDASGGVVDLQGRIAGRAIEMRLLRGETRAAEEMRVRARQDIRARAGADQSALASVDSPPRPFLRRLAAGEPVEPAEDEESLVAAIAARLDREGPAGGWACAASMRAGGADDLRDFLAGRISAPTLGERYALQRAVFNLTPALLDAVASDLRGRAAEARAGYQAALADRLDPAWHAYARRRMEALGR